MEWLNLKTNTSHAREFIMCEPLQRATWLSVSLWSAEQENGGRLVGAKKWKDRTWQQLCGVTLKEVNAAAPLLTWDGDDLVVWNYPVEKEREVQHKRIAGAVGGSKRTDAKAEAARANGAANTQAGTQAGTQAPTEAEPKQTPNGRERNGIGRGRESAPPRPPVEKIESEKTWLERLCLEWPGIDVREQLRLAQRNRRREGKPPVERDWFVDVWLKQCSPVVLGGDTQALGQADAEAEPQAQWRECFGSLYPSHALTQEGHCIEAWKNLPPSIKRVIREKMAATGAHAA